MRNILFRGRSRINITRFTYNIIYCATVMQDLFVANSVARHTITQNGVSMMFLKGNINSSIFFCFKFVYNLTVSTLFGMNAWLKFIEWKVTPSPPNYWEPPNVKKFAISTPCPQFISHYPHSIRFTYNYRGESMDIWVSVFQIRHFMEIPFSKI